MTCRSAAQKTLRVSRTRLTPAQAATGQFVTCNAATGQLRHCNGPITHRTIAGLYDGKFEPTAPVQPFEYVNREIKKKMLIACIPLKLPTPPQGNNWPVAVPASYHHRHNANPPGAPHPPQGPPRRAPRLPTPRLPAPRLPARCLPHLHRLVACRIHTREACRPVSATPPPPSLLACAKRCDSAPSRLLEHATLRQLCDPVRLCT